MDLELDAKAYLVTGGSSGLGLALAHRLVGEGAAVALMGRDANRVDAAVRSLPVGGGRVVGVPGDVTSAADCERAVETTVSVFGRLDGLVNGAGHRSGGRFLTLDDDEWLQDFQLKLLACVRLCRLAMPALVDSRGAILNVLSVWSRFQTAGGLPSSALRAAGLAVTNTIAAEHGPDGVRANAVLVGVVESGQWNGAAAAAGTSTRALLAGMATDLGVPLGRPGRAEEFADVAAFLLSPRAAYVTGAALNVDGGLAPVS